MIELQEISKLDYIRELKFDSEFILISKSSKELVKVRFGAFGDYIAVKSSEPINGDIGDKGQP